MYAIVGGMLLVFCALPALIEQDSPGQLPPRPAAAQAVLSLADAVQEALARSDRAVTAREHVDQADLSIRLARSGFAPKLSSNLFGSFGQTDIGNQSYGLAFSQRFITGTEVRANLGAMTSQNQLGNFYSTDTTFLVSQPLLRGFGRAAARQELVTAESRVADAGRQQLLAEQQLAIDVATAYYRIITQQQLVGTAEKTLERARQLLDASSAKLAAGKVSRLDLLRAQQLVSEAELALTDVRTGVEDAKDQLRLLLNRGREYDFAVASEIPIVPESVTEEEAVTVALQRRPDLQTAKQGVLEAERAVALARNQLLPQVDLNLAFTRRETANGLWSSFGLDKFQFATFTSLAMPFDRTAQSVAYETAALGLSQRTRDRTALEMRISQEARRSVRNYARLMRSLELADSSLTFATQEAELATLRYQRGLSNNLDVVNAENNLLATRGRNLALVADLAVARFQLRATLGLLDPRTDVR